MSVTDNTTTPTIRSTTAPDTSAADLVDHRLFLAGYRVGGDTGATMAVEDPATGETVCHVADATPTDALAALDAACQIQDSWAATAPRERARILRAACDHLTEHAADVAALITLEMGKSLHESHAEVEYSIDYLRWYAEEAVRITGEWKVNAAGTGRVLTMRQPIGPCLLITPWNAPLAMVARKIGPAVAAGCTMIVKPAAQTPLTALLLAQVLAEAGLPDGVLSVLPTSTPEPLTDVLLQDPRLRKISFTGSTAVGKQLTEKAARNMLRTSMELGGNAPFIVCADADIEAAVDGAMVAKIRNNGEACIAANRFLVHANVAKLFTEALTRRMAALPTGDGRAADTKVGPLISATQRAKVAELVDDAVGHGARVLTGGAIPNRPGYYYPPTVLTDVPAAARLNSEEIFGPVAPITVFTDEDEAIAAANDTPYGLVSYLYTRDLKHAIRLSERLQTGMVGLNRGLVSDAAAPFGGIKQSGVGREGGSTGIDEYLELKYVAIDV